MTAETQETFPHTHADGQTHTHEAEGEHEHEQPAPIQRPDFVPDPAVQAYVTTITVALAHTGEVGPHQVIFDLTRALEGMGVRGVVSGVAAVELRGDGGLIGL